MRVNFNFILLLLTLFIISKLNAENIDSIKSQYQSGLISEKVYLNKLVDYGSGIVQTNPQIAVDIFTTIIHLPAYQKYDEIIGNSHYYLAIASRVKGDYEQALSFNNIAYSMAKELNYPDLIINCLIEFGTIFIKVNLPGRALEYYNMALKEQLALDPQKSILADIYSNIGLSWQKKKNNSDSTIFYYNKAINTYDQLNDQTNKAVTLDNLGTIYLNIGLKEEALKKFREASVIFLDRNNNSGLSLNYNNLAVYFKESNLTDSALFYFNKVDSIARYANLQVSLAINHYNKGNLYFDIDSIDMAEKEYLNSINICERLSMKYGQMINYSSIARIYALKDHNKMADSLWMLSEKFAKELDDQEFYWQLFLMKSKTHKSKNQYKLAYNELEAVIQIKDSINPLNNIETLASLVRFYELDIKNREILEKQNKIDQKNLFILISGFTLLIISILLGSLYINHQKLKRKNKILYEQIINKDFKTKNQEIQELSADTVQFGKIYGKIISLIEEEKIYRDPQITREKLARLVGTNETYISRAIKLNSSLSLSEILNKARVNEAIRLIVNDQNTNIKTILKEAGFQSERSFFRIFKKITGLTTSEFKDLNSEYSKEISKQIPVKDRSG